MLSNQPLPNNWSIFFPSFTKNEYQINIPIEDLSLFQSKKTFTETVFNFLLFDLLLTTQAISQQNINDTLIISNTSLNAILSINEDTDLSNIFSDKQSLIKKYILYLHYESDSSITFIVVENIATTFKENTESQGSVNKAKIKMYTNQANSEKMNNVKDTLIVNLEHFYIKYNNHITKNECGSVYSSKTPQFEVKSLKLLGDEDIWINGEKEFGRQVVLNIAVFNWIKELMMSKSMEGYLKRSTNNFLEKEDIVYYKIDIFKAWNKKIEQYWKTYSVNEESINDNLKNNSNDQVKVKDKGDSIQGKTKANDNDNHSGNKERKQIKQIIIFQKQTKQDLPLDEDVQTELHKADTLIYRKAVISTKGRFSIKDKNHVTLEKIMLQQEPIPSERNKISTEQVHSKQAHIRKKIPQGRFCKSPTNLKNQANSFRKEDTSSIEKIPYSSKSNQFPLVKRIAEKQNHMLNKKAGIDNKYTNNNSFSHQYYSEKGLYDFDTDRKYSTQTDNTNYKNVSAKTTANMMAFHSNNIGKTKIIDKMWEEIDRNDNRSGKEQTGEKENGCVDDCGTNCIII